MREIKFRGKSIDIGEWVEGYYVMYSTSIAYPYSYTNGEHYIQTIPHNIRFDIDPDTVCQYTGLKDKNGKEIFERDIVQSVLCPIKCIKRNWMVFWDDNHYCFSIKDLASGEKTYLFEINRTSYEIEVIGNTVLESDYLEEMISIEDIEN